MPNPFSITPADPKLNEAPVEGMSPQLIQQLLLANPELFDNTGVGPKINPARLQQFNQTRAQQLRPQAPPQGLEGVASAPSMPAAIDRVNR